MTSFDELDEDYTFQLVAKMGMSEGTLDPAVLEFGIEFKESAKYIKSELDNEDIPDTDLQVVELYLLNKHFLQDKLKIKVKGIVHKNKKVIKKELRNKYKTIESELLYITYFRWVSSLYDNLGIFSSEITDILEDDIKSTFDNPALIELINLL